MIEMERQGDLIGRYSISIEIDFFRILLMILLTIKSSKNQSKSLEAR